MSVKDKGERCAKCGRKKPPFGYLIQCHGCKRYYCKRCTSGFTSLGKGQKMIDSCPECIETL